MIRLMSRGRPKTIGKEAKIMKTMIYLDEKIHTRLKHIAVDERVSMAVATGE